MLTIYKASAGSGKTYTLAYEYIKLLLGVKLGSGRYALNREGFLPPGMRPRRRSHARILAITFTNKATTEMKGRILKELDALRRLPAPGKTDAAYAADLCAEFDCPRDALAMAASEALRALLLDYGSFNVSTIDAFFQTILRTFAREIDRQGDFRLELDNRYVVSQAVTMLFDDLNDESPALAPVHSWLGEMSGNGLRDGSDFNPFNRGGSLYRSIVGSLMRTFNEDFEHASARIHNYLTDHDALRRLGRRIDEIVGGLRARQLDITRRLIDDLTVAGIGLKYLPSLLDKIVAAGGVSDDLVTTVAAPTSAYLLDIAAHNYESTAFFKAPKKKSDPLPSLAHYDAVFAWYDELARLTVRAHVYLKIKEARNTLYALSYINDYISRFRVDNNLILLSDTNSLLKTIINDEETPFIYERTGLELNHYLIDEFQDTSSLQWHNLKPLVANSLYDRHDNLIIGDVKQSIYRWRGGDASLLAHSVAGEDFPGRNVVRGEQPGENTNYRSAHAIVRFNNTLFDRIARIKGIGGYEGIAQSLPSMTAQITSRIDITVLDARDSDFDPAAYLPDEALESLRQYESLEVGEAPSLRSVALERCALRIIDQHQRGYRWGDIAVLCRTNQDATDVVDFIMANHPEISVMSDDALLLANSSSVRLIISIMEMIDRAALGDSPELEADSTRDKYFSRRDCAIMIDRFEYYMSHGSSPEDALSRALDAEADVPESAALRQASLADDLEAIRRLAPANLVALTEAIIERKLTRAQRSAEMAYIAAFTDVVIDYCNAFNPTLHSFLSYWASHRNSLTIAGGSGQDAVSVLTVHSAKGLEWDCVHIPLMNWKLADSPGAQWFELNGITEIEADDRPPMVFMRPDKLFMLDGSPFRDAVSAQVRLDTADNLNVAYVAFTRAVRELDVNLIPDSDDDMATAVIEALSSRELSHPDIMMPTAEMLDTCGNLHYGTPTAPSARKAAPAAAQAAPYEVAFTALNRQATCVESLASADEGTDEPSIGTPEVSTPVTDEVTGDNPALVEAARRGNNLHNILARMITTDDLDEAVASIKDVTDEEREAYRDIITSALASVAEFTDRWFGGGAARVLTEQTIYVPRRDENYRPDRLVWHQDGSIDVVDYKFTTEHHDSHDRQVRGYMSLLREMGYERVRGYVWYPERGGIISVRDKSL